MSELNEFLPTDMDNRDALLDKFDSVSDLASSYNQLSQKLGQQARVPSQDAPKEEWEQFHQTMGAPQSAEGYPTPDSAPEILSSALKSAREAAHAQGVSIKQWEAMANTFIQAENEKTTVRNNQNRESVEEWKRAVANRYGDQLDQKSALAERALNGLIEENPDLKQVMDSTGLGHHPAVMDFMVTMGENMSDDTTPGTSAPTGFGETSAKNLAARGRKIGKIGSLQDVSHPDYEEHFSEFMDIQQKLLDAGYEGINDPRLASEFQF